MPNLARLPSTRTHSWSSEYRRSSGTSTAGDDTPRQTVETSGASAEHAADAADVLLGAATGVAVAAGLRPHVGHRVLGIRQHERPAVVVQHLHAVDEHEVAVRLLHDRPHDGAL